ncbi:lipase family alpha/beta hydrolase [Ferrimonas aestuarii]|uniref:Triacylglycerol lipase n=1 Tax=Ferrimonas aestuarii TaxID=2569539 RepID=A0A4U1BPB3_9GAMM|nr:triacylglycerol lipase [Ferrimonas aestuarii]TKB54296.1 triacylglycerol lipase [Ferrimonas aestuarii]
MTLRSILFVGLVTITALITPPAYSNTDSQTQYPIVLVHGLFGFDDILGIDYFYGIPQALTEEGATVFVPAVSAANTTEVRGEQLLNEVERILALTGAKKVNLIGHSHGGPTVRYVASVAPHLVASITSVGGVNWGTEVADAMRGKLEPGSLPESSISDAANALVNLMEILSGNQGLPTDSIAATESLTTVGTLAFNAKYPEGVPSQYCGTAPMVADNGVYYFSWSGSRKITNVLDPSDAPMKLTGLIIPGDSDGLVSSCSSRLGYVINDHYRMNHLDEVNQAFGLHHLWETDPKQVFLEHAHRLKSLGL